jgi:soluble lytic murein transglycosylase
MRSIAITAVIVLVISAAALGWIHAHTSRYDYIISQAAARNGVDFHLVKALIYEESWFRSDARGPAGEFGLMQITEAAASDFAAQKGFPSLYANQLIEPELNVEIGCWYLQRSIQHYRTSPQPLLFALLGYNAGESRADAWLRLALATPPPAGASREDHFLSLVNFPKTRAYARRILARFRTQNYWY